MEIPITKITVSSMNPRKHFDSDELKELQASIEQYGILEPLIVRSVNSHYELVAGERRLRAATAAGLKKVPVVVRALTDSEVHEIMLIENLQRSQLAPLEEAQSIQVLLQDGITQEDLARKLGKSQAWVANRLRLLAAPEELKGLLISREITPKHVLAVLPYAEYPVMEQIVKELREKLNEDKACSVTEFQEIIEDEITRSYDNDFTLDIDNFPYAFRDYKAYADMSKCEGCKHIVVFDCCGNDRRYCLNRRCWKDMLNIARNKFDAERAKVLTGAVELDTVNTAVLEWDSYNRIYPEDFDTTVCHSCEKCKPNESDRLVCLDPKCYKKKKTAVTKENNKAARAERDRVWAAVDAWIDSGQLTETRWFLKSLVSVSWSDPTIKGLSKWGKISSSYGQEVDTLLDQLSENDLWPAVVRVLCAQVLERSTVNIEQLKMKIPAAAAFVE
jgi:ParB/RepB/Spo0J family partition protein